jgi:hypothetical protein
MGGRQDLTLAHGSKRAPPFVFFFVFPNLRGCDCERAHGKAAADTTEPHAAAAVRCKEAPAGDGAARAASGTFRLRATAMQRTCSTGAVARRWEQAETEVTQMSTSFSFSYFFLFFSFKFVQILNFV